MSTDTDNVVPMVARAGRLADALQRARTREQGRARDALAVREGRLQALADELAPLAEDLPATESERFALVRSTLGERLSVDDVSYVDLHPETNDYRLVRQRRDGPQVIATSVDRDTMADKVADYVAERIVEREALVSAGQAVPAGAAAAAGATAASVVVEKKIGFWGAFWWFVFGGVVTGTCLFTYAWLQAGVPAS